MKKTTTLIANLLIISLLACGQDSKSDRRVCIADHCANQTDRRIGCRFLQRDVGAVWRADRGFFQTRSERSLGSN